VIRIIVEEDGAVVDSSVYSWHLSCMHHNCLLPNEKIGLPESMNCHILPYQTASTPFTLQLGQPSWLHQTFHAAPRFPKPIPQIEVLFKPLLLQLHTAVHSIISILDWLHLLHESARNSYNPISTDPGTCQANSFFNSTYSPVPILDPSCLSSIFALLCLVRCSQYERKPLLPRDGCITLGFSRGTQTPILRDKRR